MWRSYYVFGVFVVTLLSAAVLFLGCETTEDTPETGENELLVGDESLSERNSDPKPGTDVPANSPFSDDPEDALQEDMPDWTYVSSDEQPVELCIEGGCPSVLDDVVVPYYLNNDVALRDEDASRLCRRLALDLWGRIPRWIEVEQFCIGKSPQETVDAFLASPEYVLHAQRIWADDFFYNDGIGWWRYIEALDVLVGKLYTDEISYDDFATAALIHPAFVSRFDGEALVGAAFRIFMGRDAVVAERKDLTKLWHIWSTRDAVDDEWFMPYREVVVDTRKCSGTLKKSQCTAALYGGGQVILPLVDESDPESEVNVLTWSQLTEEDLEVLTKPAKMLQEKEVFYEAAVDKVLSRFLGYQAGVLFGVPLVLIPDLRLRLVDVLHLSNGSIRAVEREVLASRLYIQSALLDENTENTDALSYNDEEANTMIDRAPWAYGPTKQMRVEDWMQSIQRFAGYGHTEAWADGNVTKLNSGVMGWCDHRYPVMEPGEIGEDMFVYHPSNYPLADAAINRPDFMFRDYARNIGGCPDYDQYTRFTGYGVILSLEYARFINDACYHMGSVEMYPEGLDATDMNEDEMRKVITYQYRNGLTRDPTEDEVQALLGAMGECLGDEEGCPPNMVGRKVCATILRTSDFLFY